MSTITTRQLERLLEAADRTMGMLRQRYYVTQDGRAVSVPKGTAGAAPTRVLDTLDGDTLRRQGVTTAGEVSKLAERITALEQLHATAELGETEPAGEPA